MADTRVGIKLLLIHGTADTAVPISHTLRMVETFVRAEKPVDLLILPEWGHWNNERIEWYWVEQARDYFVDHLKP